AREVRGSRWSAHEDLLQLGISAAGPPAIDLDAACPGGQPGAPSDRRGLVRRQSLDCRMGAVRSAHRAQPSTAHPVGPHYENLRPRSVTRSVKTGKAQSGEGLTGRLISRIRGSSAAIETRRSKIAGESDGAGASDRR